MRKIVIAIAIVLMIAGGGVSVMKALEMGPFAPNSGDEMADNGSEDDKKLPDVPPTFIDLDPLIIPIFAGDRVAATLQIQLKLETQGKENEAKINKLLPRISDAFLRDLYVFLPRHIRKEGEIKVSAIRKRLELVAQKVTDKDVVTGVLIQSVVDNANQ